VNIFLSRPFVVGDQVKFAGGSDLEGTVEAVEIMRTLLRTTGALWIGSWLNCLTGYSIMQ
jgi:small-conductance mechanosensitive channel